MESQKIYESSDALSDVLSAFWGVELAGPNVAVVIPG